MHCWWRAGVRACKCVVCGGRGGEGEGSSFNAGRRGSMGGTRACPPPSLSPPPTRHSSPGVGFTRFLRIASLYRVSVTRYTKRDCSSYFVITLHFLTTDRHGRKTSIHEHYFQWSCNSTFYEAKPTCSSISQGLLSPFKRTKERKTKKIYIYYLLLYFTSVLFCLTHFWNRKQ